MSIDNRTPRPQGPVARRFVPTASPPSLSDTEVDVVRAAANTLLMSCANALKVASLPGVSKPTAVSLLYQAETTYAGALELIDSLLSSLGDKVEAEMAAHGATRDVRSALDEWTQLVASYDTAKSSIQHDLKRVRAGIAEQYDSSWAAGKVEALLKATSGFPGGRNGRGQQ